MKTFILIRGVPGSGKSTVAGAIADMWYGAGQVVAGPFEADQHMVDEHGAYKFDPKKLGLCHAACQFDCIKAMQDGVNVVIQSNTNTKKWEFAKYIEAAEANGYTVQEIIVKGDFENTHGVPAEKVQEMKDRFEF